MACTGKGILSSTAFKKVADVFAVARVWAYTTSQRDTTSLAVKCFSTMPGSGRTSRVSTWTTDIDMADASDRIKEHRERKERLEDAAAGARAILSQRRAVLDDVNTIAAYAQDSYDGLDFKELLAAAPLEGVDLSRQRDFPREIEF